ncbi:MBG domain-containing protein, partial [Mongoliibacter ruber]
MKKFYKSLLTFLALFLLGYTSIYAQCILFPGNLVFSGVNLEDDGVNGATQNDRFSFVLLQEVSENFEIYFTDLGWTASNSFQTPAKALTDGVIKWTAPAGGVQSGTQITIDAKYNLSASLGSIIGVRATPNDPNIYLDLGNSGDQLFAFTGSIENPVFIAGINLNQNWSNLPSDKLTSSESALPASLNIANVQNVSLLSAFSNGFTDAVISGDSFNGLFSDIVSEFNQNSNWIFDETYLPDSRATGFQLPKTLSFSVTPFNFLNTPTGTNSITYGANTQFTVSNVDSRNITSYQWQISTNEGADYSDLADSGIYSGTTSATLEISKPEVSNSNYRYRVKAVDACGNEAISNHLVLTVNPRSLTVNLIGTVEKEFDGNTLATITNENLELIGSLDEDDVAIVNPGSGIYANATVGTAILVTVNDLTITGIDANNYSLSSTSAAANVGIINLAEITGVTLDGQSFVFDGNEKTLAISGELPEGTSVAYTNNGRTIVGTQEVTATISGSNYTNLILTADLTITPASITGITFEGDSFTFDGSVKTIEISGDLPEGTSVAYTNNTRTIVGSQEVTATISGANYTTLILNANLTITRATVTGVTFEDISFPFDGSVKTIEITGTLPEGTSVSYANNTRTSLGSQEAIATISGANYTTLILNANLTITLGTITGVTFEDGTFGFDGTSKTLEISGDLPEGTSVDYANNTRTNAGTQQATATISGDNYTTLVLNADLTITPATITGITFGDDSFIFDGNEKTIEISGELPEGTSVDYTANTRTNVGTQAATATISGDNYTTLVLNADLTITPATITGITFSDGSFIFDGNEKTIEISGDLPQGASVSYAANTRTNVGTQAATATISGDNYNELVLNANLTITPATITEITFDDGSFTFDGNEKNLAIAGTLPDGASVGYENNGRTNVGNQQVTATISGSNYTTLILTAELSITPATVTGITFEDKSFTFDGSVKSIELTGTLPEGASVNYGNNTRTDVGTQEATATISGANYTTLILTAGLTITPSTITGVTFGNGTFIFDGNEKSIEISGELPEGTSVDYVNNTRTNAGTQQATATISGDNYTTLVLNADLTITPATITGVTFGDGTFIFDGNEKVIEISGILPQGALVAYDDNTRTDVGTQEATATISGANYTTLILNADLTITPATITGITFEDASFVFDGTEKTLEIAGTLPDGAKVDYENNGRTNVGNQQVTARITGSNFNDLVLTAELTITPATITGITFSEQSFVFDGSEKTLEIAGTLPDGASLDYENNGRTNVGNQQVTARITGSNFNDLVLTAELTITPATITGITFEDASLVFDGSEKTLEIAGSLPDGASLNYENNGRTDVGNQQVTARITGSNFNDLVLTAELEITPATITGITFEDASFVFDGSEKTLEIAGSLPDGASLDYENNGRTDVGNQQATATITGSNYNTLVLTAELTITPATITEITFEDGSFVFDESQKSIEITGTLPDGTSVAYADNTRTNVGTQQATATITGSNFTTLVLNAELTVTPATITGVTFEDGSFVFDETEKTIEITGTLPNGTSVAYDNNTRTNVGTQQATATITGSNYNTLVLTAELTITPATITGITFEDGSFVFDESEKTIEISGTLPNGTSVAYADNTRTNVGTQQATATITGSNFTTLVLNAELTVTPATITEITFEDGSFVFDESEKTIEISGTLPDGTSVTYADNTRTNVGSQQATATITGSNYNTLVLTAELTVTPATITGITFEDGTFVFDESEKTIEISGTLPNGTSVTYADNTRTNVGSQQATATITGSNYNTLVLTAELTITPATITGVTFEDGSFVFDESQKSIEITGTLPNGTSVAYADNTRTNVGTQQATATITGSNYNTLVLTAELTVTPATITGITFQDGSFVFDETEKTIEISGTLPDGATVDYENNGRTNVGNQQVTARITGSNYNTLVLTAELTITPATITGITFEDGSFVFDETEKTIEITGTLPDGTSVTYDDNTRTNAGTQQATAIISGANYTTLVLTADLTITPATITGITFQDGSFVFDNTQKSLAISGNLPDGTS